MSLTLDLNPCTPALDLVTFAAECRACGGPLRPLAPSRSDGVVSCLQVACMKKGCRRSYVIRTELLTVQDLVNGGQR